MQTQLECIPCFIRQSLEALKQITDDEELIKRALRRVLKESSEFDFSLTPPEMGQIIHNIIRQESGHSDPYEKIKKRSIDCALELYDDISSEVNSSQDSFHSAIKYSIAGNIMDFALLSEWDDNRIEDSFKKAVTHTLDIEIIEELKNDLRAAKTVLVLGDNVGETVFDKILIENMPTKAHIYYAVKNSPIINDATMKDAIESGLDEVSFIISNGYNAPGTILKKCSDKFMKIYKSSDVVIAKGQANFETLNLEDKKIYFLTQIKCKVIADKYGYEVGDWLVVTTDELNKKATGDNT